MTSSANACTAAQITAQAALGPSVNGVLLLDAGEMLDEGTLRQRACAELLRQAAQTDGLLAMDDITPQAGVMSEDASRAIEILLERRLTIPEPDETACRRHYAAHAARYSLGERVLARHVLFAVVDGVDVTALRLRAESCLLDLRCQAHGNDDGFARVARDNSNCPSGRNGGALGWLSAADCAPELARELFGKDDVGVLGRLVHSRFGLHVVEVLAREPGVQPGFDAVRPAVAQSLRQQAYATALRHELQRLAAAADVRGVNLEQAGSPLVQ